MTDTPNSASPGSREPGVVPTTAEALARLDMPLLDAMMTQRAVRRVLPDPVDDAVVLKCIELALRAPTGNNGQNWEFIVVKDGHVKEKLARRYRQAWKLQYGVVLRRIVARDESMAKTARAVQWQVDHFTEVPVLVVACLRLSLREGRVPFALMPHAALSGYWGSIFPSVQNLLLAARAMGLGASLITLPLWSVDFGAKSARFASLRNSVLRRATWLASRELRADVSQTGRPGDAPRRLRQPRLARQLIRRAPCCSHPSPRLSRWFPTSNDSAVPTSRCVATDRMAPWREATSPSALPTGPPNAAMRCGHAVRVYGGASSPSPTNAWAVRKDLQFAPGHHHEG